MSVAPQINGKPVKDVTDLRDLTGRDGLVDTMLANAEEVDLEAYRNTAVGPGKTQFPCPRVVSLGALVTPPLDDPNTLLGNRYLCRGAGLLLVGPTGIGKSSLSMQAMVSWALGRPFFGIAPSRPLRSLIIQAENDDGDMAEMRNGVLGGSEWTEKELETAYASIQVCHESGRCGAQFCAEVVEPALRTYPSDLLWLDPAHAYHGGDASSQEDVSRFLRRELQPLLEQYQCAAIIVHHTNKPPTGKEKVEWIGTDLAYLGSGSAEWANWPRAVVGVRSLGVNGIYELCLGKRGSRVGWRNEIGEPIYSTLIGYSKEAGRICWRSAEESELEEAAERKKGAPKKFTAKDLLAWLGSKSLSTKEWKDYAANERGMGKTTFYELKQELENQGQIYESQIDRKWARKP